jgi:uncharacterized repeat protein (TIGR01451 family)
VVCTTDNDVWIANSYGNSVTRYDNNGNYKATIGIGNQPTGVAVDAAGKVWACDLSDPLIFRINAANSVDLSKEIKGSGGHYTYSDMTGYVARTITTKIGTWTVNYDSGTSEAIWDKVSWNGEEPAGTSITVQVRSSNDKTSWSDWESAVNGSALSATPDGRYLQIETTLKISSGDISPILYDLTPYYRLPAAADLAVTKTDSPDPAYVGQNLTYTVTVTNNGPNDATGAIVTDSLPAGVTFVNATASQGYASQNGGIVTWNIGNLTNGQNAGMEIVVIPTAEGTIINTAETSSQVPDPNTGNNQASQETLVKLLTDLAISKSDAPDPVAAWSKLTYTLTVINNGPYDATNVIVKDTLPAGATFDSATGDYTQSGNEITWQLDNLAVGESFTATVAVTPTAAGTISNTVVVSADQDDLNPDNNSATADTGIFEIESRMTGGGSVFTPEGLRVTHGFTLSSLKDNSNNIEVNWGKGNKFHLDQIIDLDCIDDPAIAEKPPTAGFDTMKGTGTGSYNGIPGAVIEFTFTDGGEPGTKDMAAIVITDADGNVVLSVSGYLNKGNQQAHKS